MPQPLTLQQAAIQDIRGRYERGELPFDAFHRAMDALLLAETDGECRAILAELRPSPLAALEPPSASAKPVTVTPKPAPAPPAPSRAPTPVQSGGAWKMMLACVGEVNRLRRPWKLTERFLGVALVGEMKLDLSLAALPRTGEMRIVAVVGSVTVYVPRSVRVRVHSISLVGEVSAFGEKSAGILNFGHEESAPEPSGAPAESELDITVAAIVGEVRVVQVDGPVLGTTNRARLPAGR